MLGAFDIKYLPHTAGKGLVLTDLVVEFTEGAKKSEAEVEGIPDVKVSLISISHHPF